MKIQLSEEQKDFIDKALIGNNIIVNACIGSGKTTSIQELCNKIPENKKILYLTYNNLLKLDAKCKIKNKNTMVTNYHGFCFGLNKKYGVECTNKDPIEKFLNNKNKIKIPFYDILIMDEYQDINTEISELLLQIKEVNPDIQIIAVGDMDQRIHYNSTLDIEKFINNFCGENHLNLNFTTCFRLNKEVACFCSKIWNKKINGVNSKNNISIMRKEDALNFLANKNPKDILVLGPQWEIAKIFNELQRINPIVFNKNSVYGSIPGANNIRPSEKDAIFTTFDSSKGLEKKICVVVGFTKDYWEMRSQHVRYNILKNLFGVALTRGKEQIILVDDDYKTQYNFEDLDNMEKDKNIDEIEPKFIPLVQLNDLLTPTETHYANLFNVSTMFDYNVDELINKCYDLLNIKEVNQIDTSIIDIQDHDALIDLSPCIEYWIKSKYFKHYNIDKVAHNLILLKQNEQSIDILKKEYLRCKSLKDKILFVGYLLTGHERYKRAIFQTPKIDDLKIKDRISNYLTPNEIVQEGYSIALNDINIIGIIDALKDEIIYKLTWKLGQDKSDFLQIAISLLATEREKGILWNIKTNKMFEITIKDTECLKENIYNCLITS